MRFINSRPRILASSVFAAVVMTFLGCVIAEAKLFGWSSSDNLLLPLEFAVMFGLLGGLVFGVLAFWLQESERLWFELFAAFAAATTVATVFYHWIKGMADV